MSYVDRAKGQSKSGILLIALSALNLMLASAWGADKSLVLYLPLDEGEGTAVQDASNYSNKCLIVGDAVWVDGKKGNALQFVTGSHVVMPPISQYDVTSEVSLLAWVRTSNVPNWARVIDKSQYQTSGFDLVLTQNVGLPRLEFFVNNTTSLVDATTVVNDNEWHFLAGTFGNKTLRIYVDGVREGEATSTGNVDINPNNLPVMVGAESSSNGGQQFFGAIDEVAMYDRELADNEIQDIFQNGMPSAEFASGPYPVHNAVDVPRDVMMSWKPGGLAKTHDVYFGTVFDDVNNADRANPKGVLVSQGQDAMTYDPAGLLAFGQTYYWRIDEVNAPPTDATRFKGNVWSFTAESYGYPVRPPIKATASSYSNALAQPDKTIDGSGIDALDQHSTSASQMWLSKKSQTPVWVKYEFDAVYSLHQMWVWNQNQMTELDNGYGAKDVTIEVSTDGATWTAVAGVPEFAQATGEPNYVHNTTVDFGGVPAKFVRLNINSNWGDAKNSGLSEVRFFYVPVKAFEPTPATGATGVAVDGVLNWRSGRKAASHEVYLGTDPNALSKVGTVTEHRYSLASAGAEYDRKYYWKVNEVNEAQTPKTSEGDVWSFSTPGTFVVDDFESYDDNCRRIYYTWVDGYGSTTASECGGLQIAGNGSGAGVGNQSAPYAEQTLIHGGKQSLPLFFDNPGATSYSEAIRTFAVPQDWVQGGVKTLVLYFQGAVDNAAGQLYVKINNNKVLYNGKSDVLKTPFWRQWNIDLASVSGTLRSVGTLTIGVSGTGKGVVYVDDIGLYRSASAVVPPFDPGTAGLSAYYAFEGDVKDTSGKGNNGTANGDPTYMDSLSGLGKALVFDGINDNVDLPIGTLISTLTSTTFTLWVNVSSLDASWPRIFDFGTGNTNYIMLTPHQGTTGPLTCDIRVTTATLTVPQTRFAASRALPTGGWHHVAVVIDGAAMNVKLYQDGTMVASGTTTVLPKDLGKTTQNWLGRSQFTADAYLIGELDEFRIYNRALSEAEVHYLAGDR